MQEMAREQSRSGSAGARSEDTYPFSTLAVWRRKLTEDIAAEGVGEPAGHYRLRLLLEQARPGRAARTAGGSVALPPIIAHAPSPTASIPFTSRARMWSRRCWAA